MPSLFRPMPAVSRTRHFICAAIAALLSFPVIPLAEETKKNDRSSKPLLVISQLDHEKVHEKVKPCVVGVRCTAGRNQATYYGSGVVIGAKGAVMTSSTVVPPGASKIRVQFPDGETLKADEVARSVETESVVLQLKRDITKEFPFLPLGDSQLARVGDRVYTAGNPHHTLVRDGQVYWSVGTLSGIYTAKSEDEFSRYKGEVFETDAAVNHGCDGGPLLDAEGRLIGLLSLCYSGTRKLGTAVPLHRLRAALDQAIPRSVNSERTVKGADRRASSNQLSRTVPDALRQASTSTAEAVVQIRFQFESLKPSPTGNPQMKHASVGSTTDQVHIRSGVLIEPGGTVITNAGNIPEACHRIEVQLTNGQKRTARMRGRHEGLDVLVLTMDTAEGLPRAALRPCGNIRQGKFVTVLGAATHGGAFDANGITRTIGIVSAVNRLGGMAHQLDAMVNSGNAGGAVSDLNGHLLGIVTHTGKKNLWAQNSGVGFFAPAEKIARVINDLRAGRIVRKTGQAFLGVRPVIGNGEAPGVRLSEVIPTAAAWQAGLRKDDIITAISGKSTRSWPSLVAALKTHQPGDRLEVEYLREQRRRRTQVVLQEKKKQ